VFLCQAEHLGTKIDGVGGSRPKRAWVEQPGQGPAPTVLVWLLGLFSLTSSSPGASRGKILTPKKISGQFESGKVPKTLKYTKQVFMFCRVITKIWGSVVIPHKSS
jgi:hypothetical protein